MWSYVLLLCLAVALHIVKHKPLVLLAVVASGIFVPIPVANFYFWCVFVEVIVCLLSAAVGGLQAYIVCGICLALTITHLIAAATDGRHSLLYHYTVQILEHAELIVCCMPNYRKASA